MSRARAKELATERATYIREVAAKLEAWAHDIEITGDWRMTPPGILEWEISGLDDGEGSRGRWDRRYRR
jgi:hypothetical protein